MSPARWASAAFVATTCWVNSAVFAEDAVGLVFPVSDVRLSVPVAGVVKSVQVRLGQAVKKGQPMLVLDDDAQQLEYKRRRVIAEDTSSLESAKERQLAVDELAAMTQQVAKTTRSISKEELLKVQMDQLSARGSAKQLAAQKVREQVEAQIALNDLQQRTLIAPVAGTVVALQVDAGEWAKPGDDIIRLVDSSQVELRLNVSPQGAVGLRSGAMLQASFDNGGDPLTASGRVSFVSPMADAASGLIEVRIRFDNKRAELRPGSKAVVRQLPVQTAR